MATTKVKLKVAGLVLDKDDCPVLELRPQMEADDALVMVGTADDMNAFRKLFGRVVDARLTIGAEDETVAGSIEDLRAHLTNETARAGQLADRLQAMDAELVETRRALAAAKETPATAAAVGPNHPVVQLARGYLTVLAEDAKKHADLAKGGSSGHFLALAREANAGLQKLAVLVPAPKSNGTAAAATPAAEA